MKHIFHTVCFIILFKLSSSQSSGLLDYTESNWPSTCQGQRQTPIDFPTPNSSTANSTYFPVNNTKILLNTYQTVTNIRISLDQGQARLAFLQPTMGELFFQKNGLYYRYILNELHFHASSEHTFNKTIYDLEMHLVHSKDNNFTFQANPGLTVDPDAQQQKLVVGILFSTNNSKTNLAQTTNNTFIQALKLWNINATVDNFTLNSFSSPNKNFFHYEGGLTTPACQEFVNWIVMTEIESISANQYQEFMKIQKGLGYNSTNRRIQALNGRKIYYSDMNFIPSVLQTNAGNIIINYSYIIILIILLTLF